MEEIALGIENNLSIDELEFNFYSNKITNQGAEKFFAAFRNHFYMTSIKLSFGLNAISSLKCLNSCFDQLSSSLKDLSLDFTYNQISNLDDLILSIKPLEDLYELELNFDNNKITDEGLKQFSAGIQTHTSLNDLTLSFDSNLVTNKGIKELSLGL